MIATRNEPVAGYPNKKTATIALHQAGKLPEAIADEIGSTVPAVVKVLQIARRDGVLLEPPPVGSYWTEEKVSKAVRLFDACMTEVAQALSVPKPELRRLWVKGTLPQQPVSEVRRETIVDAVVDEPVAQEPDRDDDEAQLAALAAEEEAEENMAPAVAADPAPAFQAQAIVAPRSMATAVEGSDDLVWLMDDMDRYLHESLDGFTTNPRFAWKQPRHKVKAVHQRLPHTRILDVVVAAR